MRTLKLSALWKTALTDSSHYLIANLAIKLLAVVVIPIITRMISIEEFAVYDLFLSANAFAIVFLSLGMDSGTAILIAEQKNDKAKLSGLLKITLLLSLSACLILCLVFLSIVPFLPWEDLSIKRAFYFSVFTFSSLTSYLCINFSRWIGRIKVAAYIGMISTILGIILGFSLLSIDKNIDSYFLGLSIGGLIGAFLVVFSLRDCLKEKSGRIVNKKQIREILTLSLPYVPNYLCNTLMVMADRLVILAVLDSKALGIYALLSRIASIPNLVINVASSGFLPILYKNYETPNGKQFIREVLHIYFYAIPLAFLLSVALESYIVEFMGGKAYSDNAHFMSIMLVSVLVTSATQLSGFSYNIKRKTQYIFYITFFALILNLGIGYVFALQWGLWGVFLSTLLVSVMRITSHLYVSEKLYSFSYSWIKIVAILVVTSALLLIRYQ
ncbi:lipopolysaccharide biosynthesis protein [Pleionea sp. CnH1-48]|uniref:lipopolysaccharide biosynthesis protein n=1 Tax=Pleionea sp. CnH1-48 TaxID=2954494 RepID=UPI00209799A3|nr:oligosaccharide flippase family protein [Pleionea sp. CnH1-48]MCO7223795.1 oligosaccharide flippase family protein [Pleionea sp. CnH1-48]